MLRRQYSGPRYEPKLDDFLDLLAASVALALILLTDADRTGIPRMVLAAGFTFFVPGRAIVTNWRQLAGWSQAAMPVVLSVAVLAMLATITLWAHAWNPLLVFQVEAWLSLAGLIVGMARRLHQGMLVLRQDADSLSRGGSG